MFDPKQLLDQFLGAGGAASRTGGLAEQGKAALKGGGGSLATGALAGGLVSLLLTNKKARKLGGKAAAVGGLALVGALAYKAWQSYQSSGAATPATSPASATAAPATPTALLPPPSDSPFAPARAPGGEAGIAELVLKAMIYAAKADGHIDADEQARIFARIDEFGLGPDARGFVFRELSAPLDVEALAAAATTPELAAEVYTASLLAIVPDQPAERAYLDHLAVRLKLPPALAAALERTVAEAETA